ncbi:hypothetical protein LTR37_012298 [Vermiconidia calcicola]|uniref:Uncharacterized protein n=1 Tax=Vermiconidia calcicola TaxID=1690605 RepID=A0ACC3MZL7_9PEZI|nr:hypothetical protein LTR37_012298 [Vermiconidia calcicola]
MHRKERVERLKDDEDAVHDHLDELQAQRRAEYAIHDLEGAEDDPAGKKVFVTGTDNAWFGSGPTDKMLVISRATAATTTLSPVAHALTRNQQPRTALAALPHSTSRVTLARVNV